jgi:hypothetical protein
MKIDHFLNFRKGRSPVKIDQFLKMEVTHEINQFLNFKNGRSLVKIDQFQKEQVIGKNRPVS